MKVAKSDTKIKKSGQTAHYEEFQSLVACLKKIMKAKRVTYASLAKQLKVSEATIKRFFTGRDGSVGRLSGICSALSITFPDLVAQAKERGEQVFSLSLEQETFFASNPGHFAFFHELIENSLGLDEIREKHGLNRHSTMKYVRQLEKMGLLEWLPADRIRMKVEGTHNWLDGGPLQSKFLPADNKAFLEYMQANFQRESHFMTTSNRYIHPETLKSLVRELAPIFSGFRKRVYRDEVFYPKDQLIQAKWLLGIGPYSTAPVGKIQNL